MAVRYRMDAGDKETLRSVQLKLFIESCQSPDAAHYDPGVYDGQASEQSVKALQRYLADHGADPGKIDGKLGANTIGALQRHLKEQGLYQGEVDGSSLSSVHDAVDAWTSKPHAMTSTYAYAPTYASPPVSSPALPQAAHKEHHDTLKQEVCGTLAVAPSVGQEAFVADMAKQNGDAQYIMVNKQKGTVGFYEKGKLLFEAPALTGKSLGDVIPASTVGKSIDDATADEQVTPAGRYTAFSGPGQYGDKDALYINGVTGADWSLALHETYTGDKAEHRPERYAKDVSERRISNGCINVQPETMDKLLHAANIERGMGEIPVYIAPHDDRNLRADLFRKPGVPAPQVAAGPEPKRESLSAVRQPASSKPALTL